jgi:hypothetical protein
MNANGVADLTAAMGTRGSSISGEPGRRPRRRGVLRSAVLSAACVAGAAAVVLGTSAMAGATVSQTSSQWEELGPLAYTSDQASQVTAVYAIASPANYSLLLEDHGNQMNNGAVTDLWNQDNQATGQDPMNGDYGPTEPLITQANQLWEFVPQSDNSGGQITTGYGQLINRQSGLCLDINGAHSPNGYNYADGATVDQWQCVAGAANEEWSANYVDNGNGAGYVIYSELSMTNPDDDANVLGVGNGATCDATGDGEAVYSRTSVNACDVWDVQQTSYDFATYQVSVPAGALDYTADNRSYECVNGYNMRGLQYNGADGGNAYAGVWTADFDNISTGSVSVLNGNPGSGADGVNHAAQADGATKHLNAAATDTNEMPGGNFWYQSAVGGDYGQVLLYCDPQSTTP